MSEQHYKIFRATTEPNLHILCIGGIVGFDKLPERIRKMGPWQGGGEGHIDRMRPHYRALLAEQGFVVLFARQDLVKVERSEVE